MHKMFTERKMTLTVYAVGMAMEKNPEAVKAMVDAGWEVGFGGGFW